ncbi:MAG: hypothetical protein AB2A00_41075 [Myxococcota bacterium]
MTTFRAEEYQRRVELVDGWHIRVTSYRLAGRHHCKIDNIEPGALIARAEGATRDEAEADALGKAKMRLSLTRRFKAAPKAP